MFSPSTYVQRRQRLLSADALGDGIVLLLGNEQCPMNYRDNPYPFRQDSTFLYYVGVDVPGLAAVMDLDDGTTCLYGDDHDLDSVVWMGERPSIPEHAERCGISQTDDRAALQRHLSTALDAGRDVHFLPPYRARHREQLASLMDLPPARLSKEASLSLVRTVVNHRSQKSEKEIDQLNQALETTARMHEYALRAAQPGVTEREIVGSLSGIAEAHGRGLSFRPTCSVHGEVLHNHHYDNTLKEGDLLLVDAGASSPLHYAGDITRVAPVGGSFTKRQRALYNAVLDAQTAAIDQVAVGRSFRDIHLHACRVLTERLVDLGLMRGDPAAAVEAGAHALFFPHGLGHMLGLDTHDMESLGEDVVGYTPEQERSEQFGLHTLRLARPLRPGFVVTIEPGCYFIPELIRRWQAEDRHSTFINYDVATEFVGLGGIRIEDDVHVTEDGPELLGPDIPKSADEVTAITGRGRAT